MLKNLLMCLIVSSFILCGCTERTRQKGVLGLSDGPNKIMIISDTDKPVWDRSFIIKKNFHILNPGQQTRIDRIIMTQTSETISPSRFNRFEARDNFT